MLPLRQCVALCVFFSVCLSSQAVQGGEREAVSPDHAGSEAGDAGVAAARTVSGTGSAVEEAQGDVLGAAAEKLTSQGNTPAKEAPTAAPVLGERPEVLPEKVPPTTAQLVPEKKVPPTAAQVVPEKKAPPTTAQLVPEKKVPPTTAQVVPEKKAPPTTAQVVPEKKEPPTTAQVVPGEKAPPTTAQVVPEKKAPPTTAQVVPEKKVPPTTAQVVPGEKAPPTTAQVVPEKKAPPTTAQVEKAPPTTAQVVPEKKEPPTTAQVVPEKKAPQTTAQVMPGKKAPPTTAQVVSDNKSPPPATQVVPEEKAPPTTQVPAPPTTQVPEEKETPSPAAPVAPSQETSPTTAEDQNTPPTTAQAVPDNKTPPPTAQVVHKEKGTPAPPAPVPSSLQVALETPAPSDSGDAPPEDTGTAFPTHPTQSTADLSRLVDKCSFSKRLNPTQAASCKEWKHALALRRRVDRWETQRRDALESVDPAVGRRPHQPIQHRAAADLNFQDFFLRHALDLLPAVIQGAAVVPPEFDVVPLTACGDAGCSVRRQAMGGEAAPPAVSAALKALAADLVMPPVVANDFLQRIISVSSQSPSARTAVSKYSTRWPRVYADHHVPLHTSPLGMHRLVAPLHGSLSVLVVDGEQEAFFYPFANGSFPPGVDVFHPNTTAFPALRLVTGRNATLSPGDALFVPSGAALSWHAAEGGVAVEADAVVLEHCFLDASNLNRVKSHLMVDGLQDEQHAGFLEVLQSRALDTTVSRQPSALPFADFSQWPRPPAKASTPSPKRGRAGRANRLKDWQDDRRWTQKIRQLAMPAPSTPLIHATGRLNVTLRFHCPNEGGLAHGHAGGVEAGAGDTQPVLGYTVVWHAHRMGDEFGGRDKPGAGPVPVQHGHRHSDTVGDTDMSAHSLLDFDVQSSATFLLDDAETEVAVGCGGVDADVLCVTVTDLLPNHLYVFRVAAKTELGTSTFSESSPTARTNVLTAPVAPPPPTPDTTGVASVRLRVAPPVDDGGLPITAYVVTRQVNWLGEYGTHVVATVPSPVEPFIDLTGLLPATGYRFRVAAVNGIGVGNYSAPGPGVTTKTSGNDAAVAVVGFGGSTGPGVAAPGRDPEGHVRAAAEAVVATLGRRATVQVLLDRSGFGGGPAGFGSVAEGGEEVPAAPDDALPCLGPIVTVSDTRQEVEIVEARAWVADGWACHHSPRQYDVRAELVASRPLSGKAAINMDVFRSRVVYFDRGEIALRDKVRLAAQAGALAVVVGDTTGRCDAGFTQTCVPGGDKRRGEGFAKTDAASLWAAARVPTLIVDGATADHLRAVLT